MSDLNLTQIEDKLNSEFEQSDRAIIFWYDANEDFTEYIENINIKNAKIHHLTPTNLFKTKVLLERQDKDSNYLIYAPFKKLENRENHLADIIIYSKEFFADASSLLCVDLGIDTKYKPIIDRHIKFFNSKDRKKRFYDLEVDRYSEKTIEIALLSALVKSKTVNFEEVTRIILSESDLYENKHMNELSKYNLDQVFWKYCNHNFSYEDEQPSLIKLSMSLLLTYANNQMGGALSSKLENHILDKPGTVMAFVDQMMNSSLYKDSFRKMSREVYSTIDGDKIFKDYQLEDLLEVDVFKEIDENIIAWILERLIDENLNVEVNSKNIDEICKTRKFKHFRDIYSDRYDVLINGYYLMLNKDFKVADSILELVEEYDQEYYKIDTYYRKFYYHLDRVEDSRAFEDVQTLVENIYVNKYLDIISKEFGNNLDYNELKNKYRLQKDFYGKFVKGKNERIVVIISDAFRYEIGKELVERFNHNEKVEARIEPLIGVVPSYTSLGMAVLLPHEKIEIDDEYKVYVNGKPVSSLNERNVILQSENPNSDSIQYDDLIKMKSEEMRAFFVRKEIIYIYHNQIDNRGEQSSGEDEVFVACNEAIEEIEDIIRKLTNNVSATNFIITADHGFIYTRNKNKESDKIERFFEKEDKINKRFIISENNYDIIGTKNILVSEVLGGYDNRTITTPLTSNIFKTQGGGQNFIHGGSSPQEVIIPLIQVKTTMGAIEVKNVKISLISMISKITGFELKLDFFQQEAVSDVIKPAKYKIRFVDEFGELISNEEIYTAKSKSENSSDRMFNLIFRLRNKSYSRDNKHYFIITDTENGMEIDKQQVIIDIPFVD